MLWFILALTKFRDSFFESSKGSFSDESISTDKIDIVSKLSEYANKQCVVGNLNINSLQSKLFTDLQEWVEVFDVLSVQETKVDKSFPNSQFALKGYKMYRQDRKKDGGRILLYICSKFSSYQIKVKCKEIEAILINIQIGQQKFSLLTVYKSPSVKNEVFMQELSAVL